MKSKNCLVRRALPLLVCVYSLPACLPAQQNKLVVAPADPVSIRRGGSVKADVKVTTLPGFHVNSDKPKEEYLIPLSLTWTEGPLKAKEIVYPQPETITVGPDSLSVFTGDFRIKTDFIAPADAPAGSAVMLGKLHYQACNNRMCFRPSTIEVRLPVTVE